MKNNALAAMAKAQTKDHLALHHLKTWMLKI